MKKILFIMVPFLFLFCSNKNNPEVLAIDESPLEKALSIKKIELDSIRQYYENRSSRLKVEILNNTNIDSIPTLKNYNYKNASSEFSKILKNGNDADFDDIMIREINYNEDFDSLPYVLYMAETHNSRSAYFYIWLLYYSKNRRIKAMAMTSKAKASMTLSEKRLFRDRLIFLDGLEDDERSLALASLIKSAQLKYTIAVHYLSDYFKEGVYVNKDVDYADQLYKVRNN